MTEEQIAALAERVLRPRLGRHGFERVSVEAGRDHDDDPAVFIVAHYGAESDVPSGAELVDASVEVARALRGAGEGRQSYLDHRFHKNVAYEPGDDDEADDTDRTPS